MNELRNTLAVVPMEPEKIWSDNLSIALASYFDGHVDCPDEPIDEKLGWKPWVMDCTDAALDRIVACLKDQIDGCEEDFEKWWAQEGSVSPLDGEDLEEFVHRMTRTAWLNATYKVRQNLTT